MQCEGACIEHLGEVVRVRVFGEVCPDGWDFNYCQAAIQEDESNDFRVELLEQETE